jgi:RNA polymerase sigma-70 factor (ECF subfamily)
MNTACTLSVSSTGLTAGTASLTVRRAGLMGHGASLFSPLMVADISADISDRRSLAQGLQRRDPAVLDQLIELYQFRLFRYLLHLTSHRERAEDFFQETWIRVLERGHQYDGKSKFASWLFTIARNLVIDWQRQKKMQSLDTLTDPAQEQPLQVADTRSPSPLHVVMSEEQDSFVRASVQQLSLIYREVVVLRFHEELQIEEIAQVMQLPVSTVKTRLYRGLEAMRVAMQGGAG